MMYSTSKLLSHFQTANITCNGHGIGRSYFRLGSKFYRFFDKLATWDEANDTCHAQDARLPSLQNVVDYGFLANIRHKRGSKKASMWFAL